MGRTHRPRPAGVPERRGQPRRYVVQGIEFQPPRAWAYVVITKRVSGRTWSVMATPDTLPEARAIMAKVGTGYDVTLLSAPHKGDGPPTVLATG